MKTRPFDEHALAIAKRQYLQPGDGDIYGMFRRVANWVATPEKEPEREVWAERFYQLMSQKRFCPGGRVLAGAATAHGNVLNCFVQGATQNPPASLEGIMEVAKKLALVTKVGGGNGVNLDPYRSAPKGKKPGLIRGFAYMRADHPDVEDFIKGLMRPSTNPDGEKLPHAVRNWTRVVYGTLSPELAALAREHGVLTVRERPEKVLEIADDMGGIMDTAAGAVRLALSGEEPHVDFSRLRPEGAPVKSSGGTASGPTSYLIEIYDNFLEWANRGGPDAGPVATLRYVYAPVLRVVRQGGTRRGAGMATLDVAHPDLFDFLTAKDLDREAAEGDISTFNISVLITNRFIEALDADALWPVEPKEVPGKYYPVFLEEAYRGRIPDLPEREDGARPVPVFKGGVPARWIWHEIAWHAWTTGEPGLIFVDRVNEKSALKGLGERWAIRATNPCGEIPLTVGEPCDLGAMNLAAYVQEDGRFDFETFRRDVRTAVRFLDNVLDVNHFVLEDNREASRTLRRLGLGVMGLADALIEMDLPYDSEEARRVVERIMDAMREEATAASEALAEERGVFPLYAEHEEYFKSLGIRPRRNVALLTVAPTGTTSMLMGVSSGIEPVFAPFVWRRIGGEYKALVHPLFKELLEAYPPPPDYQKDGGWDWDKVTERIQENHGSVQGLAFVPERLQRVFKCAHDVAPLDHVRMQGAVQRAFDREGYVGNSLSKTINLPHQATVEDVEAAYSEAWRTGCKGITVYRDGSREFQVIRTSKTGETKAETPDTPSQAASLPENPAPAARPFGEPVFERTGRLFGFTDMVKLTASDGTRYSYLVTVNMQGAHPVEVILTTGKAGDEQNADAEALGRVVSIALQYGVPPEAIVHTLRGINGGLYGSYFKKFVASKGDLIALALEQALKLGNGENHPLAGGEAPKAVPAPAPEVKVEVPAGGGGPGEGPTCPECGGPVKVEDGCLTCQVCGWSKCG